MLLVTLLTKKQRKSLTTVFMLRCNMQAVCALSHKTFKNEAHFLIDH